MAQARYGIVPDCQIPYELPDALGFVKRVRKEFKIPRENWICAGDELDQMHGGLWKKSPEANHTAIQEIEESKKRLRRWYKEFPEMKVAISNHGTRWVRKAFEAEIPSQLLKSYREVIEAPEGWQWRQHWIIKTEHPFLIEHGDHWSGPKPAVDAAIHNGISTAMGHHHTKAQVDHVGTAHKSVWGMVVGCLIDFEAYAFDYARNHKLKPRIGMGVVVDNGKRPIWVPYY